MPAVRRLPGPRRVPATTASAHTAADSSKALHHNQIYVADAQAVQGGFPQLDQCFGVHRSCFSADGRVPVTALRKAGRAA